MALQIIKKKKHSCSKYKNFELSFFLFSMTMTTKAGKTISKTFKQAYLHTKKETMNERLFFFSCYYEKNNCL